MESSTGMRPPLLFPLFAAPTDLKGVGPARARLFERLGIRRVKDLLFHLPSGLVDRRIKPDPVCCEPGTRGAWAVRVVAHHPPADAGRGGRSRRPWRVETTTAQGTPLDLVFFHADGGWLARLLPEGAERIVCGTLDHFRGRFQIAHPEHVVSSGEHAALAPFAAIYPTTQGLAQQAIRSAVAAAFAALPELPEWQRDDLLKREDWPDFASALRALHHPRSPEALAPDFPARRRLACDELLASQLALALVRERLRRRRGRARAFAGDLRARLLAALPYALTGDQRRTLEEIENDMRADAAMLRLLQGDVGAGKTVVALAAVADAVEAGDQAALLAPTEILARQHFATAEALLAPLGIRPALLTGRVKGAERARLLEDLAGGGIDLLIGTHALIGEGVAFARLGFVVIDEQHRFGVAQRLALTDKADHAPDVLVMTATPIPRTLTLTVYGDMDVSRIREKPPGRTPVDTRVISLARLEAVIEGLRRAIAGGARVYWICPLVAESESLDLAAAQERFTDLRRHFGDRVGLLTGRMKGAEKDAAMRAFAEGAIDILVSTTVVEVGVDVPEATVMVIEHAERFGLAQLHQLRGRVGRGAAASRCLLLRGESLSAEARQRLEILRASDDGFEIAEADLRLRGAGELLGTRQSGLPDFRFVDPIAHTDLMEAARDDARLVVARDPGLETPRGRALRVLLHLFERDAGVRFLKSG